MSTATDAVKGLSPRSLGFAVGFHVHTNVAQFLAGLLVLLLFGCALSAIFALVGLSVPNGEAAQAASFPMLAPLVFASSAFVPIGSMPGWLQAFAKYQPVSVVVDAIRLCHRAAPPYGSFPRGGPPGATCCSRCCGRPGSWPCSVPGRAPLPASDLGSRAQPPCRDCFQDRKRVCSSWSGPTPPPVPSGKTRKVWPQSGSSALTAR